MQLGLLEVALQVQPCTPVSENTLQFNANGGACWGTTYHVKLWNQESAARPTSQPHRCLPRLPHCLSQVPQPPCQRCAVPASMAVTAPLASLCTLRMMALPQPMSVTSSPSDSACKKERRGFRSAGSKQHGVAPAQQRYLLALGHRLQQGKARAKGDCKYGNEILRMMALPQPISATSSPSTNA